MKNIDLRWYDSAAPARWRGERVRIIGVVKDEDPLLATERRRISAWAPANAWHYLEYADAVDLLARITDLNADTIHEMEIVAHGNPAECDDIALGNVRTFGESLRRVPGFSRGTLVYLSGCNTGLRFGGDCLSGALAEGSHASVCGARGYLAGTHAEQNERCVASFTYAGIEYRRAPRCGDVSVHR